MPTMMTMDPRGDAPYIARPLRLVSAGVLLVLAGCLPQRQAVEYVPADIKRFTSDPAIFVEGFRQLLVSADSYGVAHDKFLTPAAKGAMNYEAFVLGLTTVRNLVPTGFDELVRGLRQHRMAEPHAGVVAVRWCNPEFGFSREFKLVQTKVTAKYQPWLLDLSRADLEAMQAPLLAWYRKQKEVAGDQRLVYPPYWKHAPVARCACDDER